MIKKIKLSNFKLNPDNPRSISEKDMDRLKKSIESFTRMLEIRPIVYDENNIILGGNMRFSALQALGYKEAPETWFKSVTGLTEEEKRQFIIVDNGSFGKWDFDALANGWDDLPLIDFGIDLPEHWFTGDEDKEPSKMYKNFQEGKGSDCESESNDYNQDKYPVTFILTQQEWETWERIKEGLKVSNDKSAFLKIMGGFENA